MDGLRDLRRSARHWLSVNRPRLVILLVAAVALGGIVCMCLTVAVLIVRRN
jgi:hypothetical protein